MKLSFKAAFGYEFEESIFFPVWWCVMTGLIFLIFSLGGVILINSLGM